MVQRRREVFIVGGKKEKVYPEASGSVQSREKKKQDWAWAGLSAREERQAKEERIENNKRKKIVRREGARGNGFLGGGEPGEANVNFGMCD